MTENYRMEAKGAEYLVNALNINQVRCDLVESVVRLSLSLSFQTLTKLTFSLNGVAPEVVHQARRCVTIEVVREDLSIIDDLLDIKRHSSMMVQLTNSFPINCIEIR